MRRATRLDDLWLAEKFQSNSVIAGSLRNSFRTGGCNGTVPKQPVCLIMSKIGLLLAQKAST